MLVSRDSSIIWASWVDRFPTVSNLWGCPLKYNWVTWVGWDVFSKSITSLSNFIYSLFLGSHLFLLTLRFLSSPLRDTLFHQRAVVAALLYEVLGLIWVSSINGSGSRNEVVREGFERFWADHHTWLSDPVDTTLIDPACRFVVFFYSAQLLSQLYS